MFPTKDEITDILVKNIVGRDKAFDKLQNSWFTKHLIIALREALWAIILVAKDVYDSLSVRTAAGVNLDNKGYDFGIDRKAAVKAVHRVTLAKSAAVKLDTHIPDGFLLSTTPIGNNPPIKFKVVQGQELFIPVGKNVVEDVIVECTEYGVIGNVADGAINLVAQSGFDTVKNSRLYIAGAETEADVDYRERILQRKRQPARAGVPDDWKRWALEVEGVTAAKCYRCARGAGTADVVIWGENGEIPSEGLIEKCQKYFEDKYVPADLASGGILAVAPEAVEINISIVNAVLKKGYTKEMVVPILAEAFSRFFVSKRNAETISVVDCIVCARTAYDAMDSEKTPVIEDFVLSEPCRNIPITGRQSPLVGSITVEASADG